MAQRSPEGHVFRLRLPDAEEVYLACDCLGWFAMHKVDELNWELTLRLPTGRHHVRYYVRMGNTTLRYDEQHLEIPAPAGAEQGRDAVGIGA